MKTYNCARKDKCKEFSGNGFGCRSIKFKKE